MDLEMEKVSFIILMVLCIMVNGKMGIFTEKELYIKRIRKYYMRVNGVKINSMETE